LLFKLMEQAPTQSPGGNERIADTKNFPISTDVAAAVIEVNPGHMRELHWHLNADERQYYISRRGRMTVFAGPDLRLPGRRSRLRADVDEPFH
jgi:oxalate decarboxylase